MCKLDWPQNQITEVNAKQDKVSENAEKREKEIKIRREEKKRFRGPVQEIQSTHDRTT